MPDKLSDKARTLIALRKGDPTWKRVIDNATLEADAELHDVSKYHQVGADVGNGWQRQPNGGLWGTDWFSRAQAAVTISTSTTFTRRCTSSAAPTMRRSFSSAAITTP